LKFFQPAEIHGRRPGPERPVEIDQLAVGEPELEDAARLVFDLGPGGVGYGSEPALQVVHSSWPPPFRLPMPSEPSDWPPVAAAPLCAAAPLPLSVFSCAVIEPVVNNRRCSSADILASRRRNHSSSMVKCSISSLRLCARISLSSTSM